MRDSDRERFVAVINAVAASFGSEPTEALLEGYWLGLEDLPMERVEAAAKRAIRSQSRMPRPAELRELSGEAPIAVLAVQAWSKLREAAGRYGAYSSVDFGPVMNATIRAMGGWNRFCTEELNDFVRKDFEKTYGAFAAMGVAEEQGRHLVGLHEMTNRANNYAFDPPIRIAGVPQIPNKRAINGTDARRAIEAAFEPDHNGKSS